MPTVSNLLPAGESNTAALVGTLAAPAILASRSLYLAGFADELRVATLVEVAGAAAAMARQIALVGHVDMRTVMLQVTAPVDARAVLGLGAWLPTMVRPVRPVLTPTRPATPRPTAPVTQLDLFAGGDR